MTIELYISDMNNMFWYRNNKNHNKYGPACKWGDGSKLWVVNRNLHRLDGPACEWADGNKCWYINNVEYTYLECLIEVEQYNTSNENVWRLDLS